MTERQCILTIAFEVFKAFPKVGTMQDVAFYLEKYGAPAFTFTPDDMFPVCYGEKGCVNAEVVSPAFEDGVIFSSIFARADSRSYIKPIKGGSSEYPLTDEEKGVLREAMAQPLPIRY